MNYRNFLQFDSGPDWFSQARMVYVEKPAAPQPAPEGKTADAQRAEGKAAELDTEAAQKAAEQREAQREKSAEAREAEEKERTAEEKAADTDLEKELGAGKTAGKVPKPAPGAGSESADEQAGAAGKTDVEDEAGSAAPAPTGARTEAGSRTPAGAAETSSTISASEADVRTLTQRYEKMRGTKSDEEITNTITEDSAMRADFAIIHWAEQPVAAAEIDAALAKAREKLKSAWESASPAIAADSLPTPEEIDKLAAEEKLDFREAKALREHLKKQIEDGENLPRLTGDTLEKFKKAMGIKEKEWWKGAAGGGFWGAIGATLKKLFDKLTDLAERIGKWFSEQFGGEEETKTEKGKLAPFPTSPIAGTEKFAMRDSTQGGVDLIADSAGKQVVSVGPEGGKIIGRDVTQGKIAIQHGKTRIVYTGLDLDSDLKTKAVGTEIPKGAVLGTMKTDTLNFQMLNEQGQQIPQTQIKDLLASYAKPAETETQTQTARAQASETQTGASPETGTQKATAGTPAEGTAGAKTPEATPAPAGAGAPEATPAAATQTTAPGSTPAAPAR